MFVNVEIERKRGVYIFIIHVYVYSGVNSRTQEYINELMEKQTECDVLLDELNTFKKKDQGHKPMYDDSDGEEEKRRKDVQKEEEEKEEMVPKSKVLEMETLFMDAIERLSTRVQELELKTRVGKPNSSNSTSSADSNSNTVHGKNGSNNNINARGYNSSNTATTATSHELDWLNDHSDSKNTTSTTTPWLSNIKKTSSTPNIIPPVINSHGNSSRIEPGRIRPGNGVNKYQI